MRPLEKLIPFGEALRICLEAAAPIRRTETVPLAQAHGRVLAEAVAAGIDVPAYDRAAMDGYAVMAADTAGSAPPAPKTLARAGVLYAGDAAAAAAVPVGGCVEIATGAPVPPGADAVVPVEQTRADGERIAILKPVHPGQNVTRRGADAARGETVLAAGELLAPAKVGVAAAVGRDRLAVYARPRVAILATGTEVVEPGSPLPPSGIYDVNGATLAAVVRENGGEPIPCRIAEDRLDALKAAVRALPPCDVIVTTGGSSVGTRDLALDLLRETGKELFHGIAIKPGKPTLFGTIGEALYFGMPGYPTSCLMNAYTLLAPTLRKTARLPRSPYATVRLPLAETAVSARGRRDFIPVRVEGGKAVSAFRESGVIRSMSAADGYMEIPDDVERIEKGTGVEVALFSSAPT